MNRKYFIAILLLIAAVLVGIVLAYPAFVKQRAASALVVENEEALAKQQSLIVEVKRIEKRFEAIEKDVLKLSDLLPPMTQGTIPELFIELEGIAATNGLLIKTISFQSGVSDADADSDVAREKAVQNYRVVNAVMSLSGTYATLKNFAEAIEGNRHLMDIVSMSIIATKTKSEDDGEAENEEAELASDIVIDAYYQ